MWGKILLSIITNKMMKTINWKIQKGTQVTLRISGSKTCEGTVKIESGKGFKLRVPVKGKLENSILSE